MENRKMKRCYDDIDQDEDDEVTHETNEWKQQWQPCNSSSTTTLSSGQKLVTPSFGDQPSISSGNSDCPGHERIIVHIDLDCFYAQVEMIHDPTLREKPLGIQQKNIVVTCNYIARERGVGKLSYVRDAVKICPDLVLVSGEDLSKYRQMSYKVTDYFLQFCPLVERLGFDENFIDVTKLVLERQRLGKTYDVKGHIYSEEPNKEGTFHSMHCSCGCYQRLTIGSQIAYEMRTGLKQSLGLTSCAGIAHNKLLSKLVAGTHKPNQQTVLFPHEAHFLMLSLKNVKQIPGIGTSMSKRLATMGIVAIQQLQETKLHILQQEFGPHVASTIHNLSHGFDPSAVVQTGPPQSLSDEDSFKKCSSIDDARERTRELLTSLLQRLKEDGRVPHTLRIAVRKMSLQKQWTRESRQCPIPDNILHDFNLDNDVVIEKLLDVSMHLFTKLVDTTQPFHLTLISVCFTKLEDRSKKPSITTYFKKTAEDPGKHHTKIITKLEERPKKKPSIVTYFKESTKQQCHKKASDCSFNLSETKTEFPKVEENSKKKQRIESPFQNSRCYNNIQPQTSNNRKLISELFSGERLSNNCSLDEGVSLKGNMQRSEMMAKQNTVQRNGFQYSESMTTLQHQLEGKKQEQHVSTNNQLNSLDITSDVSLPPNVDRSVFIELPLPVQKEIIQNWKRENLMSKTKPKSKKSIKDFFKTK